MKPIDLKWKVAGALLGVALTAAGFTSARNPQVTQDEARKAAEKAYVYAYPLVLTDVTCKVMTAYPDSSGHGAPYNQFHHVRQFPDATFRDIVSPNVDTLYSTACLDLSKEPVILSVPDVGTRYYLIQMLDAWSNTFASPGTRTTGNGVGHFALVGPGWSGTLPNGVTKIQAPTNLVWFIGRTYTAGPADYAAVHAIQDQYRLTPLSAWGTNYQPPTNVAVDPSVDTKTPPPEQVAKMDADTFFKRANELMVANPPTAADAPLLAQISSIGVVPGAAFDASVYGQAITEGVDLAKQEIAKAITTASQFNWNGWTYGTDIGTYGTNYMLRAAVAMFGFGANLPQDAIYPRTLVDVNNVRLTGAIKYTLHFEKDRLPPARAFWSLTIYDENYALVANPIDRYSLNNRSPMTYNPDGSLDIYIQHESPGVDKEANWLPAPEGPFALILRLYLPEQSVIDGKWEIPGVTPVP